MNDFEFNPEELLQQLRELDEHPLNTGDLPPELHDAIAASAPKHARTSSGRSSSGCARSDRIVAEQLASRLGRQVKALKSLHLNALREQQGWLQYTHPEVVNHPQQAYVVADAGRAWPAHISAT